MAEPRRLTVEIEGVRIAHIEAPRWNDLRCRYTDDAFERWPQNTPLLSCSLPLTPGPLRASAFCRGLLAEGRALDAMASRAGLATNDTFGLLARYGRDVAGALTLNAPGALGSPNSPGAAPYTGDELEAAVSGLDDNPLGIEDDSELSLAGVQNKLLLVRDGGGWARPTGGLPSTHILKIDDPRFPGLVEAEHACMTLARAAGLDAAATSLEQVGPHRCLIIERFDRISGPRGTARVHQEDACQALGIDPAERRGRAKYERAGGPSLADVASLLDRFAADGVSEMKRLLAATTFNVIVGNADAHGKNLSLLHEPLGATALAPLYDIVPTVLWPQLRTEAAMSIGGVAELRQVGRAELVAEARGWGMLAGDADAIVDGVCQRVLGVIDAANGLHAGVLEQAAAAATRLSADV